MDTTILRKAGLTESQAKGYLALVEHGKQTPVQLAEYSGESRTNAYMIADKLTELGLAIKNTDTKRTTYSPAHPSVLESLAERRRKVVIRNEQAVRSGLSPLIDMFYAHTETPGTRTLQGIEGIKQVYDDTLKSSDKAIYLVRTTADTPSLGLEYLDTYRHQRSQLGIDTYALTPDTALAHQYMSSGEDVKNRFHRTLLPKESYTAPVEIDVYGDKVALIAFGETQMATVIDSPPIAAAMKQLITLIADLQGSTAHVLHHHHTSE